MLLDFIPEISGVEGGAAGNSGDGGYVKEVVDVEVSVGGNFIEVGVMAGFGIIILIDIMGRGAAMACGGNCCCR